MDKKVSFRLSTVGGDRLSYQTRYEALATALTELGPWVWLASTSFAAVACDGTAVSIHDHLRAKAALIDRDLLITFDDTAKTYCVSGAPLDSQLELVALFGGYTRMESTSTAWLDSLGAVGLNDAPIGGLGLSGTLGGAALEVPGLGQSTPDYFGLLSLLDTEPRK